jgi:glycosyltransferase involved in cell wall biosynthesis
MIKKNLSGHMIVRNGIKYDYPFLESCLSILPICDEFIFIDGYSDDGTYEKLIEFQKTNKKIKVLQKEWKTDKKNGYNILSDLTNYAIENCSGNYHLQIQADEAYGEEYLLKIKNLILKNKYDYFSFGIYHMWSSFEKMYAPGVFYDSFIRLAKKSSYPSLMSVDDAMSMGNVGGKTLSTKDVSKEIKAYHYGYVRTPKALIEKQIDITKLWGIYDLDGYLQKGIETGKINWMDKHPIKNVLKFKGKHPKSMLKWIQERREIVEKGIVD